MKTPKYAELENERRFWVGSLEGIKLHAARPAHIQDRYLDGTRMRLRCVREEDGSEIYKLCKKYTSDDHYSGAIVNTYLTAEEYRVLRALHGASVNKRRFRVMFEGGSFSVDVFEDDLAGLILCEAERPTRADIIALQFPPWAAKEVTEDSFFTGGQLARISQARLREKLKLMQSGSER